MPKPTFSRRIPVRDAYDRYANSNISYPLQTPTARSSSALSLAITGGGNVAPGKLAWSARSDGIAKDSVVGGNTTVEKDRHKQKEERVTLPLPPSPCSNIADQNFLGNCFTIPSVSVSANISI